MERIEQSVDGPHNAESLQSASWFRKVKESLRNLLNGPAVVYISDPREKPAEVCSPTQFAASVARLRGHDDTNT